MLQWAIKKILLFTKRLLSIRKSGLKKKVKDLLCINFFDITLDKQEVLNKPGRQLLQTPMLSFTEENGRFVAEPKELIVRRTRGPPAGSVNQPKRVCFSDLVFPPASSSQSLGSESARMVPSLLSGLSSVVPAVVAPEIPTVSSEPSPTPSPEPSPAGPVVQSGHPSNEDLLVGGEITPGSFNSASLLQALVLNMASETNTSVVGGSSCTNDPEKLHPLLCPYHVAGCSSYSEEQRICDGYVLIKCVLPIL